MTWEYAVEEFTSDTDMLAKCNVKGQLNFRLAFIKTMGGKTYGIFERER